LFAGFDLTAKTLFRHDQGQLPLFGGYFPGNGLRFKLKRMGLLADEAP
jgi:hypothetical protein